MGDKRSILVTGAGGFIGGWVAEALYLRGDMHVRAGVRRWSSAARIGRFPMDIVLCDVLRRDQVDEALRGVDYVIHCAIGNREVNTKGTENLLAAALEHGVRRFVHLSTRDVYGNIEGSIKETSEFRDVGSEYADSKIEAEKLCWAYRDRGVPVVVLRPTIVYGPYCKVWIVKFAERLRTGDWGVFKDIGEGTCNLVYVLDIVRLILSVLENENAVGQAFNVTGPETISWNEYFRRVNERLGLPPLRVINPRQARLNSIVATPFKVGLKWLVGRFRPTIALAYKKSLLFRNIARRAETSLNVRPGGPELALYQRKVDYDISKAKEILGFVPRYGIDQGLDLSVGWMRHEYLLES
jgi:nucleoside-diphosphate-sugar epimerase